jgi:hypothetical protein
VVGSYIDAQRNPYPVSSAYDLALFQRMDMTPKTTRATEAVTPADSPEHEF